MYLSAVCLNCYFFAIRIHNSHTKHPALQDEIANFHTKHPSPQDETANFHTKHPSLKDEIDFFLGEFAKTAKSDYYLRHVCLFARMELGSHWTDFRDF
jgi:hypothetical protein